ncbi:MAG: outer membrane lipoprotein-sorting protein [FCB group bacterium]|nr:outer membrane lipoprotein-sorting protein [FCB group bacterium]
MRRLIVLFFGLSIFSGIGWAQTGYDIAKKVDQRLEPADLTANLTMVLTNSKGKTRSNTIRSVSMKGGEKQMIWFLAPADDKGVAFLKIEHPGADDEMRLWLPAFKKVRRISSSKKGDSFMGSDMSYEDMTNRELDEYTYKLLREEPVNGVDCFVLEETPKPEIESTYSKHVTWISKQDYTVVKEESYDLSGVVKKVKTVEYVTRGKYILPVKMFVEDVQKNHSTLLKFEKLEVDTGVKADLFRERNLKRLPR